MNMRKPNVISISVTVIQLMLVIEYLSRGDLRNCLHEMRPE